MDIDLDITIVHDFQWSTIRFQLSSHFNLFLEAIYFSSRMILRVGAAFLGSEAVHFASLTASACEICEAEFHGFAAHVLCYWLASFAGSAAQCRFDSAICLFAC